MRSDVSSRVAAARALIGTPFRLAGAPQVADILLLQPGLDQLHLGLWTGTGLVHAHAGLRRVVETPGQPSFPLLGIWYQETD